MGVLRMTTPAEVTAHSVRTRALIKIIRIAKWTLPETLRVFSNIVFYSGRPRRAEVIAWLEELLVDLKDTKWKLMDPGDGEELWKDAD